MGIALALLSATAFGVFAVLIRVAGDEGATGVTVMALRFAIAAPLLWIIALASPTRRGSGRSRVPARVVVGGLGLGLVGYSAQAALFQESVNRTGAALADLMLYAYPAMVVLVSWLIGREGPTPARLVALLVASAGTILVLVGGGGSEVDGVGVALGLAAALAYTLYVLGCDAVVTGVPPFTLAALIASGAAIAFMGAGATGVGDGLDLDLTPAAWWAIVGIAIVGTVFAVTAFLMALELIGPSRASILSTLEPVVTVALAAAVLDERLGPVQLGGAALVVAACVILQLRRTPNHASGRPTRQLAPAADDPGD